MPSFASPLRALVLLVCLLTTAVAADDAPKPDQSFPAVATRMPGDRLLGLADAPVTIVEYASLTCGHCANFHTTILPELKRRHIEAGTVRLVYRDFPLDRLALVAAMVARCAGEGDDSLAIVERLFERQQDWAPSEQPIAAIAAVTEPLGMGPDAVRACIVREDLAREIVGGAKTANEEFGVGSTPTLFVQGRRLVGVRAFEELDAAIQPLLR